VAAQLTQRLQENVPLPGSEPALRRFIESLLSCKPDYSRMTSALALATGPQTPMLQIDLSELGEFSLSSLKGVDRNGTDVFEAVFAGGSAERGIRLGQDEKIVGLMLRHLP